ncbi:MAG: ABC transporter substrate-binding protein [Holophaga sp.]|nr:ABC transporter substrate-binding protein [Holophaga sp.]
MKREVGVILAILVALGSVSCARKKAKAGDYNLVVGVGVTGGLCNAPLYVAFEKGYFEAEGLTYTQYKVDNGQTIPLLTTGKIDVMGNLLATLIQPLANGLEVKIPLGIHTGCVKVLVPPGSPIRTLADLRGKKIGTTGMAASPTVITQRSLANIGVGVTAEKPEVEWLIFASSDLPLAMEKGSVDAIALNDPTAAIIENAGKGRVILNSATDPYLKNEYCCVVVARNDTVKQHPEAVAKYCRAIQRASKFVQEHPEETARLIVDKKYIPGDSAVNGAILKTYDYRASVSQAKDAITRNTQDLQRIGLVKRDVDAKALSANTFIALAGVPDSLYK